MKIISVQTVNRGDSVSTVNVYKAVTSEPPTPEQLAEMQAKLGYHPQGYGPPREINIRDNGDDYVTLWVSDGGCD